MRYFTQMKDYEINETESISKYITYEYRYDDENKIAEILGNAPVEDVISFWKKYGVRLVEKNGSGEKVYAVVSRKKRRLRRNAAAEKIQKRRDHRIFSPQGNV